MDRSTVVAGVTGKYAWGTIASSSFLHCLLLSFSASLSAEPFINEVLFNPSGGQDAPHEYIELRGTPNLVLGSGTYFVTVEGDTNGNPGTIENVFNLSGRRLGGNGFLVLLQKAHGYAPSASAAVLMNTNTGEGFGSGSSSSIQHRGRGGETELPNASSTFFLIQSSNVPDPGDDIDADNDGVPDGQVFAAWTILDSIGALDNSGLGDIAYGQINFRRNASATATGTVIDTAFTANYLARTGNTTGSAANDWVASEVDGSAPNWFLGDPDDTTPPNFATRPLNHLGLPNFGAAALHGVVIIESDGHTEVGEDGATDSFTVRLNTSAGGTVTIEFTAVDARLQISTNNGATFGGKGVVSLNNTTPKTLLVRALDDSAVSSSLTLITNQMIKTTAPARYPLSSLIASVEVQVADNDVVLLSEVKVNPPGMDEPNEFVELRGPPGMLLRQVYLLAVNGDRGDDPGVVTMVVDLTGVALGSSGLLVVTAGAHPYSIPSESTTTIATSRLDAPGGALGNGSVSILLISSPEPILEGADLDEGNNGVLEELPKGAMLLDAVGWNDGDSGDVVFGGVLLAQSSGTPDAATRYSYDNTPRSAAAWFNGDLAGMNSDSLAYDDENVSVNFPVGAQLSPGAFINTPPTIGLRAISGVIGDSTNPVLIFQVNDAETPPEELAVTASSDNPAVVPNANLSLTSDQSGGWTLSINPIGVGYATITIAVSDDDSVGEGIVPYAASAMGRANGIFHYRITDGSAAIPIGDNLMFVGDDENQVIRIYDRAHSGLPLAEIDCGPFLGLTDFEDGVAREVDIEAATRVGDRIYWLGSHSHADIGEIRTNRSRIFATDISGNGPASTLTYVGRYEHLKTDLIAWDANNLHGRGANYFGLTASAQDGVLPKALDGSGFNIEGLAMAPGSTNVAYVSFRAPLVPATNRACALIVPVTNFSALAISEGPPGQSRFGPPIELNLGCRGIRSIEGGPDGYLIVAGPAGNPVGSPQHYFRLYTWTGDPNDEPEERSADLTGLNVEAIVELPAGPWTPQTRFQLISDSGTMIYYGDDVPGKLLPVRNFKKFRSDWIELGEVRLPQPLIRSVAFEGDRVRLSWCALVGRRYRVQFKTDLSELMWTDLAGDVLAENAIASKTDSLPATGQRFYQVMQLPP